MTKLHITCVFNIQEADFTLYFDRCSGIQFLRFYVIVQQTACAYDNIRKLYCGK